MKTGFTVSTALALLVPYSVAVSACYLFGYWGSFQINVMEFISLADVAKLAIFPLVGSLALFLPGVLISELTTRHRLPPGGGQGSRISNVGFKYWRYFLSLIAIVMVVAAIFIPEHPMKWLFLPVLVVPFATALTHLDFVIDMFPNPRVRATVLFLALVLPSGAFYFGKSDAFSIKSGLVVRVIDVERSKLPLNSDAKSPVMLMGLLGQTYVLYESKSKTVVLIKQKEDLPLFLVSKS